MHPAYSVIFFTTLSGAGYGLLIWLAAGMSSGWWPFELMQRWVVGLLALILIGTGLLSSLAHLGRPERSWRALSQWRTSWLSREGVVSLLSFVPALAMLAGLWTTVSAILTIGTALATLYCTGMIYASLKTVPRWHNPWVAPLYLLFALSSGGLWFALALAGTGQASVRSLLMVQGILLLAWVVKWGYWRFVDEQRVASDSGTATGLGQFGAVSQFEPPHTADNYLLKEMGYRVARRHARRLRLISTALGLLLPLFLLAVVGDAGAAIQISALSLALVAGMTGQFVERWLFFAEARHVVTLYYGRDV